MTAKGQITVPKQFRDAFGLRPGDEVEFTRVEGGVKIMRRKRRGKGEEVVERLRQAAWDPRLSTARLMKLTRG